MIRLRSENGCGSNCFHVMMKFQGRLITSLALDANVKVSLESNPFKRQQVTAVLDFQTTS